MQAKRRCTAPDDIGASSMDSDSEFSLSPEVGIKMGTGDKVKAEGEGGPAGCQYLKAGTPSPY